MFGTKKPQFTDDAGRSSQESFLARAVGPRPARWIFAVLEIVQVGVLTLALVVLIRTFLIQPFYVKGASMEPNFLDHEYLIIDEISYRFREPERGEIIVFRYPRNPREYFIKRIIGLPGERITIADGRVRIDGALLDEPYLEFHGGAPGSILETILGEDEYFLLGDNRPSSLDSRVFGAVPRAAIVGRAWLRGWPIGRAGLVPEPEYQL